MHDGYCCLETFLSLAAEPPTRGQIHHRSNNMYVVCIHQIYLYLGPTIPPVAGFGLVHKKIANQIHQTFCEPNTSITYTKQTISKERHLGSPSPYHSVQTLSHLVSLSLSCSDQIVLIMGYQGHHQSSRAISH